MGKTSRKHREGQTHGQQERAQAQAQAEHRRTVPLRERVRRDARLRTRFSLVLGALINLLYAVLNLVSGVSYHSVWSLTLAGYYTLLALLRGMVVHTVQGKRMDQEWRCYRRCGILLLLMNQVLTGMMVFVVQQNRGFSYPGSLIYAMAFFAFFSVYAAVAHLVQSRRQQSPALMAAGAIKLVAALVSVLALETAMLARFGGDDDPMFQQVMTALSGGAVCLFVIVLAVFMIAQSTRHLKRLARPSLQ